MSIKHKIKFKEQAEKKEKLHEKDRPRYEEQSEEEYLKHCERFFKGEHEDNTWFDRQYERNMEKDYWYRVQGYRTQQL